MTFYAHSNQLDQLVTSEEFKTTAITIIDWIKDLNEGAYRGVEDWSIQPLPGPQELRLA
jgi:hypothetical protein